MGSPFVPENALEMALMEAAADPAARPAFYRTLLEAQLYFLTPDAPAASGRKLLHTGEQLRLIHWQGPAAAFVPCFTSATRVREAAQRAGESFGYLAMAGREAFQLLAQHPTEAILNPGFPFGKQFLPEEIRQLAGGLAAAGERQELPADTQVTLGQPAVYPQALVDVLRRVFARNPTVEAAWLAQIHLPASGEPPHPIVGIQSSDHRRAVEEAGIAARDAVDGPVDFVDASTPAERGIVAYLRNETDPFYLRTVGEA